MMRCAGCGRRIRSVAGHKPLHSGLLISFGPGMTTGCFPGAAQHKRSAVVRCRPGIVTISMWRGPRSRRPRISGAPFHAAPHPGNGGIVIVTSILTLVTDIVTYRRISLSWKGAAGRQTLWRGECGARGRICTPHPGGSGHHAPRHYDRGVRCCHWTGTGRGG